MKYCNQCGRPTAPAWVVGLCECPPATITKPATLEDIKARDEPVSHNANPPDELGRAIRGVKATVERIEVDLSRLKTLLAELEAQP